MRYSYFEISQDFEEDGYSRGTEYSSSVIKIRFLPKPNRIAVNKLKEELLEESPLGIRYTKDLESPYYWHYLIPETHPCYNIWMINHILLNGTEVVSKIRRGWWIVDMMEGELRK